jgi:hypothetical protein
VYILQSGVGKATRQQPEWHWYQQTDKEPSQQGGIVAFVTKHSIRSDHSPDKGSGKEYICIGTGPHFLALLTYISILQLGRNQTLRGDHKHERRHKAQILLIKDTLNGDNVNGTRYNKDVFLCVK